MKQITKNRVRNTVKKGVVKTRVIANRARELSKKIAKAVKKKSPSQKEINIASRTAARVITTKALAAEEKAKIAANKISKFSHEITESVKKGIKDAKKESKGRA